MPMQIYLQSAEDVEMNDVFINPLVLVWAKIFQKSEGIESIEDFYVTFWRYNLIAQSHRRDLKRDPF